MKPAFLKLSCGPDGVTAEGDSSYYHGNAIEQADGTRNGVYSEWSWDGQTLCVETCRYGMSPLFYYCGKNSILISNSMAKLLALGAPSDWDDDAMAVFIRRQTFLGEDTPFKEIRVPPPGARLTWSDGKMSLEGGLFASKPQSLNRNAVIDGVIELFSQSITRRLPGSDDFYLPLTGGKDSRHILLELARQSALPKATVTASFPPPMINQDKDIARQLSERAGVSHIVLPPAPPGIGNEQRKNLATNFCSLDHGWAVPLADFLKEKTTVSYDGLGLDVFFNTIWYSDYRAKLYDDGAFEALAIDLLRDSETAFSMIFTPEANRRFSRARAIARMVEELKRHADHPHPIAALQFWSRTRRATSTLTFGLQHSVPVVHTPFLDYDLFDFVYSTQRGNDLMIHFDALTKAFTDFDEIDYVKSGVPESGSPRKIPTTPLSLTPILFSKFLKKSSIRTLQICARMIKATATRSYADYGWLQPLLINYISQIEKHACSNADY